MTASTGRSILGRPRPVASVLTVSLLALQLVAAAPAHAAAGSASVADVSKNESNVGTTITFEITRDGTDAGASVDYTTQDGIAKAGEDYLGTSGTLIFGQNQPVKRVSVNILGDLLNEDDETFSFVLSNPSPGFTIARGTATGTILNDDAKPRLSVADVAVDEGNAGTTTASFVVTLNAASGRTVTVDYATADATATHPADYKETTGTLTFNPGDLTRSVPVPVVGDLLDEIDNETFTLALTNLRNADPGDLSATGTIADDDVPPSLSIDDVVTPAENGTAHFTVTLSQASGRVVKVNATTTGGTATANRDYESTTGEVTFNPGEPTSKGFDVKILEDTVDEPNETFTVNLSGAQAATVADPTGTATITDDDGVGLSIDDVEGFENAGVFRFSVTLTGANSLPVTVNYATAPGSATAGVDYTTTTGTLTFLAGSGTRTQNVAVPIVNDVLAEPIEDFTVNLSGAINAEINRGTGTGRIKNDDGPVSQIDIADPPVPVAEGAESVSFTVSRSAVAQVVTVDYTTRDGTAVAGQDYVGTTGLLTFAPNETTKTITVRLLSDALDEDDTESFMVELSNPVNGAIGNGSATGLIADDDPLPVVSVADVDIHEGDNDSVVVTLSPVSGRPVKVDFTVTDGTAVVGKDYTTDQPDTITFAPGETSKRIAVAAADDALDEEDRETFTIGLTNPVNVAIGTGTATVGILDDDAPPTLRIADADPVEEPADPTGRVDVSFAVSLRPASGRDVTFHWATADDTAVAPGDYRPDSGDITIPAGQQGTVVVVRVKGDNEGSTDQASETFKVTLTNPVNATFPGAAASATGTGTILDTDGPPTLTITGTTVTEGNADADVTLTVRLVPAAPAPVTVNYATANGTAAAPGDYGAASGTLTFPIGVTEQTFKVRVVGDGVDEADEAFSANLSNASGATIGQGTAQVSILDDDGPAISVADTTVTEGDAAGISAVFLVSLSAASSQPVTVGYTTSNGTATSPKDYARTTGTLTFNPGEVAKPVPVPIAGDNEDEADETFTLRLSNPTNATIGRVAGTATIVDDDQPTLAFSAPAVAEGDLGEVALTFTLVLDAPTARDVSVDYATADGTARGGVDYVPAKGSLSFTPGETTKRVVVQVVGDSRDEIDETFFLRLSGANNVTIGGGGVATILDDDRPGYALVATDGGIFTFGGADFVGSTGSMRLNQPIVGMAPHPSGRGYWLVATDGGVFTFGEARFHGSTGSLRLNKPIVGMAATPTGNGYWLVASDGGIFAFGDAKFRGSTGSLRLNKPIVGMAATPSGDGYWLVASDGGIFAFNAPFKGSTGSITLNKPIVGMAAHPSGDGYWLVASDGGIFAFNAPFKGSTGSLRLNRPIVGMAATPSGNGYWMVATDGGIFAFGDAEFLGSTGSMRLNRPVVGMAIL